MAGRIAIGSDHAGFHLKERIKEHLAAKGLEPWDLGGFSPDPLDYPDPAHAVADAVRRGEASMGVLICGSGVGVSIAANRHKGVRAALAWRPEIGRLAREHNDANVLALPARFVTEQEALAIIEAFLGAAFEGGRHQRRVEKIEC
ncbi:MAG: ribose 5-phosphate isomerase B [Flavobacteriales bacterium]